jgi:uncharacterized membrane protein
VKVERAAPMPQHVKDAVAQISAMQASHHGEATFMERVTDRIIAVIGTSAFLFYVAAFTVAWVAVGLSFPRWIDTPPFPYLELTLSLAAILIAVLILASQRRDDLLADRREQMTLQVSLLTEQKVGKLIELVEELRRDLPNVHNRIDLEAIEMTGRPDHAAVLDEIQDRSVSTEPKPT